MEKLKKSFEDDYEKVKELLEEVDIGDQCYSMLLVEKNNVRKQLIEVEELKNNKKAVNGEKILKWLGFVLSAAGIGIGLYEHISNNKLVKDTVDKTFKFEETGTITTTQGRSTLNGLTPRLKR